MSETLELRDLRTDLRRRWWVPALLALAAAGLGVTAGALSAPVYRAEGTLLVGPVNGTVIRSTTLRASESLATFYADLARRQIVLDPVVKTLHLPAGWDELRNRVSAVTPDQNPRLVAVTVLAPSSSEAGRTAAQILEQLVSLSPHGGGGDEEQFVSEQTTQLKTTIESTERQDQRLRARLAASRNPRVVLPLQEQLAANEKLLNDWRHTYVELMAVDLSSDAGGLQVIDDVTTARSSSAAGMAGRGTLAAVVGAILGLAVVMVLRRRPLSRWRTATEGPQPGVAEPAEKVPGRAAPAAQPTGPAAEPDQPAAATAKPVAARQSTGSREGRSGNQDSGAQLVVDLDADRLESLQAALRPPRPGPTPRSSLPPALAATLRGGPAPSRRPEGKPLEAPDAPGRTSGVSPVERVLGRQDSVPVATPAGGKR